MRLVFLTTSALLMAGAAHAQRGFVLAPSVFGASVTVEDADEADTGGGLGLRLGYGVSRTVTVYATLAGASIEAGDEPIRGVDENYALGMAEIGAQFNLLPSNAVNPFLRVALAGTAARFDVEGVDSDDDPELRGGGITLGGGAAFRLSPSLAVEAAIDLTGGRINEFEAFDVTVETDDADYGTARLGVGLVWRP